MLYAYNVIHIIIRYIRKLLQQVNRNKRIWSCILFASTWISMTSMSEEKINIISAANKRWYANSGRERIRGGICHTIHQYEKTSNKYISHALGFRQILWMLDVIKTGFHCRKDKLAFDEEFMQYFLIEPHFDYACISWYPLINQKWETNYRLFKINVSVFV